VKRPRPSSEEPNLTGGAVRRQQLREKRRAERDEAGDSVQARKAFAALEERRAQLRDEVRLAEQAAMTALEQAREDRAHQLRIERARLDRAKLERASRKAKATEHAGHRRPANQQEAQQAQIPAQAIEKEQPGRERSKKRTRREQELYLAILAKKEQRLQAAVTKAEEEAHEQQRRSESRKQQKKELGSPPDSRMAEADLEAPDAHLPEAAKPKRTREEDESQAQALRQLKNERQQRLQAELQASEQGATQRQQLRREQKKQGAELIRAQANAVESSFVETEPTPMIEETLDDTDSDSTLPTEARSLTQLGTIGNFIVDDNEIAVALRGVNIVGLDTIAAGPGQALLDALALDESNLALMTQTWGLNLIRLPFLAQTVLSGNGSLAPTDILSGLDLAVQLVSAAGTYVLLAVEAAAGATMPNASTQEALQVLAMRYKENAAVLYELFASPTALDANWFQAALSLIGTIRQQNTAAMIFVNTGTNGTDFSGLPLTFPTGEPIFNLVYTVNVTAESTPGLDDSLLASFADQYPVFASIWSDDAESPSRLSPYLGEFFGRHNVGWAAANWNADPRLVADAANHDFTSTGWGLIVGRAATLPVQPYLKPF